MSKTILITGTSSGFGRDTAETLHRAGHTVYASMRGAQGKNREAAEALRKLGIKTVELDVSDDASVEAGVKNSAGGGRQDRCAGQQRRHRVGRRNRSLHHGTGEGRSSTRTSSGSFASPAPCSPPCASSTTA